MLVTAFKSARSTVEAARNSELSGEWVALIGLRGGMSIYAGWLTAATILGAANMFKHIGMSEENGWNEEDWTIALLWIALFLFAAFTYLIKDPVYGAVLLWASVAIRAKNVLDSTAVEYSLNAIIILMSVFDFYVVLI